MFTNCSARPHRDRAQKIALADVDAAMAQNVVGGREMEIEVGQHKMVEIIGALHTSFVFWAERKADLALGGGVDLLEVERF